ncbi:MAG: hypothetical protein H6716_04570 [Polyangiaceae bacterium]|nr:hypothetical protein [Polyangiaceae bacterium]
MTDQRRRMRLCVAGDDVVEVAQRLKRLAQACARSGLDEACYGCGSVSRTTHVDLWVSEEGRAYDAVCAAVASLLRGEIDCEFQMEDGSSVRLRTSKTCEGLLSGHSG